MDIGSTKLTSEDKRWIGAAVIVSILWLYLPFRFVSILNHIHQEAIEHPFLGIDSSDGPEGCFFTFFTAVIVVGDFGLLLIGIGTIVSYYENYEWGKYRKALERNQQENGEHPKIDQEPVQVQDKFEQQDS